MVARKDLALASIRSKFADWRRSKKHGDPIPDFLWDEVHALEKRIGRTRLARDLGLNGADMAFQMSLRGEVGAVPVSAAGTAVPPQKADLATPPSPSSASQTVAITKVVSVPFAPTRSSAAVEIESPSGWVMRLQADASPDFLRAFVEATIGMGGEA
jgi:hypothetical protein